MALGCTGRGGVVVQEPVKSRRCLVGLRGEVARVHAQEVVEPVPPRRVLNQQTAVQQRLKHPLRSTQLPDTEHMRGRVRVEVRARDQTEEPE
jgi:hypothetical protein